MHSSRMRTARSSTVMGGWTHSPPHPTYGQTNASKNIIYPHLRLRTVIICRSTFDSLSSATKLWQGNIFRSVCQEFCPRRGGICLSACWETHTPPAWADTPSRGLLLRTVRILLECILVRMSANAVQRLD